MLEMPESATVAAQLKKEINGKQITEAVAGSSPHGFAWYFGDPADYGKKLKNKKITDVISRAGQVEIAAGNLRILLADGINIRYLKPEAPVPKKHQLLIVFSDNTKIICTIQMYGGIYLFQDGENDNYYYKVSVEKPSVLSDVFDEKYFKKIISEADLKLSIKALLATEQRIPGLGNGCLQDILFNAKINPQTKLSALNEKDKSRLFKSVKKTIKEMTAKGGRDTEKDIYGNPGRYATILSNKTFTELCPNCGSAITRKAFLGGNVYFCPDCQPVIK